MTAELAAFCRDDLLAGTYFKASLSRKNTSYRTTVDAMHRTLISNGVVVDNASVLTLMAHLERLGAGRFDAGDANERPGFRWSPDLLTVAVAAGFTNEMVAPPSRAVRGSPVESVPAVQRSATQKLSEQIILPSGAKIEIAVLGTLRSDEYGEALVQVQSWLNVLAAQVPPQDQLDTNLDEDSDDEPAEAGSVDTDLASTVEDDLEQFGAASAPTDFEHLMALALRSAGKHRPDFERVLMRRYKGRGAARATLEDVAKELNLTRERIRQIQERAMRRLRPQYGSDARRLLARWETHFWESPATAPGVVTSDSLAALGRDRQTVPGSVLFALGLAYGGSADSTTTELLRAWLDEHARQLSFPSGHCWVSPKTEREELVRAYAALGERDSLQRLPAPLQNVAALIGVDAKILAIAAGLHPAYSTFAGYLLPAANQTNMRRSVRTHVLLHSLNPNQFVAMLDAWKEYRARFSSEDACSANDLRMAVDDPARGAPHLFAVTGNNKIQALGETVSHHGLDLQRKEPKPAAVIDGDAVPARVFAALEKGGPMTRSQIAALTGLNENQFQPHLDQRLAFGRVGRNLFWLSDRLAELSSWRLSDLSIDEEEAEYYVAARIADEPMGLMPLWSLGFEQHLCERALSEQWPSKATIFSVARPCRWSVTDELRQSWEVRCEGDREPCASRLWRVPARVPNGLAIRFLIASLYVRDHGGLSWISLNAIVQSGRPMATSSVLALMVLCRVGVLLPPHGNRWDQWHAEGPRLNAVISALEFEFVTSGSLDCSRGAARQLIKMALENDQGEAWYHAAECTEEIRKLWNATKPHDEPAQVAVEGARQNPVDGHEVPLQDDAEAIPASDERSGGEAAVRITAPIADQVIESAAASEAPIGEEGAGEAAISALQIADVLGVTPVPAETPPAEETVTALLENPSVLLIPENIDAPVVIDQRDRHLATSGPVDAALPETPRVLAAAGPKVSAQSKALASLVEMPTSELVRRANAGDVAAQCQLGVSFLDWSRSGPMSKSAMYWLERAGGAGHARAQRILGVLHLRGKTELGDRQVAIRKGIEWLALAMRAGDVEAIYWVGLLYLRGEYLPLKPEKGRQLLVRAALNGHADAGYRLARDLAGTDPVAVKGNQDAMRWMTFAAERGSAAARSAMCQITSLS